jgi:1,4-dihydroxy-2-naphthoate octaprenyltransferase
MQKTKSFIGAMRLRTLPLSLSGIIAGSGVAYHNGFWNATIFALALSTTILFQILSNFANDLGDSVKGTDNSNRIGPTRSVQSGEISKTEMKSAVIVTTILSLISAGILIFIGAQEMPKEIVWFYIGLAILCIVAAITYTVGKKAYGYHGMGDIMVFIFFGLVSVLGVYSLYAKSFLIENISLAIFIGLLSTAVLNLNNMRDYKNDAASGKNTIVVKMGPNNAKFYHALLIIISLISLAIFLNTFKQPILFLCMAPTLVLLMHIRKVMQTSQAKDFDPELKKVALTTFAVSIFVFVGLILTK